jgi:DNA repair protein RadC
MNEATTMTYEILSKRKKRNPAPIKSPQDVFNLVRRYRDYKQEQFIVITLNGAHKPIKVSIISIGLVNRTIVQPREVFVRAIQDMASAIIICHNHPSGSLSPSPEDNEITETLCNAGELLGIQILDHIIFSNSGFISLRNEGSFKNNRNEYMSKLPNLKHYRECPQCQSLSFGKNDAYCSLCGCKLMDCDEQLAGIRDYAKSLLILYLINNPKEAGEVHINEIPDYALGGIRDKGLFMFNKMAIRQILTECWNEVESALDDYWLDNKGADFHSFNIEDLYIHSISWHTAAEWQEITKGFDICEEHLNHETIAQAIDRLKSR